MVNVFRTDPSMQQISKSTLALVIMFSLLCALFWKIHQSVKLSRELTLERALVMRAAAQASDSQRVVTIARPWVRTPVGESGLLPESLFDFTDIEWQALTNIFADKLSPLAPEQLMFAEGMVTRVSSARLRELSTSESVQTNACWFLKP